MGSQQLPFTMSSAFWDQYLKYRPPYPDSLCRSWLDFHRGPLDAVHDLGTGCGIGAQCLLMAARERGKVIKRMYLSDPGATNLNFAAQALNNVTHPSTAFDFRQVKGESAFLEPDSVDLVTAYESMHWMDTPVAIDNVLTSLRPGGTFAVVFYHVYPTIRNNVRAERAFRQAAEEHYSRCAEENLLDENWRKGHLNASTGLDFIHFDLDKWEDVKRIYINTKDYEYAWPWPHTVERLGPKPPSRVDFASGHETRELVENWEDWQMESCTPDWLRESMISLHSGFDAKTFSSAAWREMESAASDTDGLLHVTFPVTILLARKRM